MRRSTPHQQGARVSAAGAPAWVEVGSRIRPTGAARAKGCIVVLALACLALATPAQAQQTTLAGVDSLITRGDYAAARLRLEEWWKEAVSGKAPAPAMHTRALFLRAQLETDPISAQDDYLAIVLGHPTAREAPAALLYLGQGLLATGDHYRALTYLERLARDYPASPHRPTALLWLVRVRIAAGQPNAACTDAREGSALARDPDLEALFRAEGAEACAMAAQGVADKLLSTPPEPRQPQRATTTGESPTASPPARSAGPQGGKAEPATARPFALQAGAFRGAGGAATLAGQLRKVGFEPRIIFVPGSPLYRVRIGFFRSAAEAEDLIRRVRAAGFEAVLVSDTPSERSAS